MATLVILRGSTPDREIEIGERTLRLGDRTLSPQEVSALILRGAALLGRTPKASVLPAPVTANRPRPTASNNCTG